MYSYVIIDDERLIRLGLISRVKEITTEQFVCVGEASNGEEGLEIMAQALPDIVITDMKMAKMDGVEFLQQLHEQYPATPVIVISGYKAFDYMSKAIEYGVVGYVLKPFSTEEIEKQLMKAVAKLESRRSIEQLKEKVDTFEKQTGDIEFLKVILEPWNLEYEEKNGFATDNWHVLTNIYTNEANAVNLLRECGTRSFRGIPHLFLENPGSTGEYFLLFTMKTENEIRQSVRKLPFFLKEMQYRVGDSKFFAAVGCPFYGLSKVNHYFQKNRKMLRNVYLTDRCRIFYEDSFVKSKRNLYSDDEIWETLVSIKYNPEQEKEILKSFFGRFSVDEDSLLEIGTACKKLLERVDEWAISNQVDTDDIMGVFYRRYRFQSDLEKMEKEVCGYISLISMSIREKNYGNEYLREKIVEYIQQNYYRKITLQILADQFYISASQCSNLLKERMDKGLNEYLMDIRIAKAKELLDVTMMSAEQISREVGYPNPKYFFRMFKQATTFTPIEYRNRKK